MKVSGGLDVSGWTAGLNRLSDEALTSLARSMGVAGGQVLRDEAKRQAPVETGLLRDSIYLAFKDARSTEQRVVYSVSWNAKLAPHGHLLEFGHWHVEGGKLKDGGVRTKFTPAKPFLRPAYDIAKGRAAEAMIQRGKQRLPELLSGKSSDD